MTTRSKLNVRAIAVFFLVILIVAACLYELSLPDVSAGLLQREFSDSQAESLRLLQDLVKIFMNWSIGVIGATAFFFRLGIGNEIRLRRSDLAMFSLTILLAVGSLFFGHLVLDRSISILAVEQYPARDPLVNDLRQYQYLTGLATIAMFAISVLNYFMRGVKE